MQTHPIMPSSSSMPGAQRQGLSPEMRSRLVLVSLPLLICLLIAASIVGLQAAAQRSLQLGYPDPHVHITSLSSKSINVQKPVNFAAAASGRDLDYSWDFGDGTHGNGSSLSHTYQQISQDSNYAYTVTVTVKDPLGHSSTDSTTLAVLPPPPTASFTYTEESGYYTSYNQYIDFDASPSTVGTQNATYAWSFGDGYSTTTQNPKYTYYYGNTGTYTVTLTITDDANQTSAPVTMQVNVQ